MGIDWGAELQHDRVASRALLFTDVDRLSRVRARAASTSTARAHERRRLRGGARAFGDWTLRAGSRVAHASASAPPIRERVRRGRSKLDDRRERRGRRVAGDPGFSIDLGVDEGSALNLDDLTSRQRTGPGFQLETRRST